MPACLQNGSELMRHVFILSDLHLGGRPEPRPHDPPDAGPGTQLCLAYGPLIDFVDWVRQQPDAEGEIELIINGDIVDLLAEDDYPDGLQAQLFTPEQTQVIAKLEHIAARTRVATDPAGRPRGVFEALRDLCAAGKHLTLLLGNHDVELALPAVRAWLLAQLGGPSARLRLVYDGEAYTVGRLLVEHGNRYDRWNQIDHSALRQERSMRSRGLPIDEKLRSRYYFLPPAGSHLVIHVMNRIKARYRFVDLLKPEVDAVLPMLLALEPDYFPELDRVIRAVPLFGAYLEHGLAEQALPRRPGDLADVPEGNEEGLHGVLRNVLGSESALFLYDQPLRASAGNLSDSDDEEEGLLYRTARWLQTQATAWATRARSLAQLGGVWLAADDERLAKLHQALWSLGRKNSAFQIDREEPAYLDAVAETARAGGFQVVAYGHTHLPKQIVRSGWTYLNSGTWADVVRVPALTGDFTEDRAAVEAFMADLRDNQLAGHRRRYLSFLEVVLDEQGTVKDAALRCYGGPGSEREAPLTAYAGS